MRDSEIDTIIFFDLEHYNFFQLTLCIETEWRKYSICNPDFLDASTADY